jgi:hypothetical protein
VDSEVALKGAEMKIEHELYTVDALVYAAARYKILYCLQQTIILKDWIRWN